MAVGERGIRVNEVVKFLSERVFHLATTAEGRPHVRPFGAIVVFEGKPYICTNNTKNVFKQMLANPNVEISACGADGEWMRVTCKVVHDPRREARVAMLLGAPGLESMYSADDGRFEVLYLADAKAIHYTGFQEPLKEYTF